MILIWLKSNILIAMFFVSFALVKSFFKDKQLEKLSKAFLYCLPLVILAPYLVEQFPAEVSLPQIVKTDLGSVSNYKMNQLALPEIPILDKKIVSDASLFEYLSMYSILFFSFLGTMIYGFVKYILDIRRLYILKRNSLDWKAIGGIEIYFNDEILSPMSFLLGKRIVILPTSLLQNSRQLHLAVSHELQHHRNGDTLVSHIIEVVGIMFSINIFFRLWVQELNHQLELRCDRNLLERKNIKVKDYASLLVDVASNNQEIFRASLAMATKNKIHRRIEEMTSKKKQRSGSIKLGTVLALSLALIWQSAFASRNSFTLKELNLPELQKLVSTMKTDIPIDVNPAVLKWVNFYLSTEKGRATLISGKANLEKYKKEILRVFKRENMPVELLGVAFIESGYRNNSFSGKKARGIWQIIPSTARNLGLRVDEGVDERINISKATQAAVNYYKRLLQIPEFKKDWRMALLAYNSGERALKNSLKKYPNKSIWEIKNTGDKNYLAKVIAGMIVLNVPSDFVISHPLKGARTSSKFGMRKIKGKGEHFHKGIDLATKLGSSIVSPLPGKVIKAQRKYVKNESNGRVVEIDHGKGLVSRYYHVKDLYVEEGQSVLKGQKIASVGITGFSTGPHLHFELLVDGVQVNPESFL